MQKIPVFFTELMAARNPGGFSPSAGKPSAVVASWLDKQWPIEMIKPSPVSKTQLALAHESNYVHEVLGLKIDNGFGTRSRQVADSLPYTTGSMLSAARHVLEHGGVACSPTSGFHHACYNHGGGFCTFNGLMVTALALHQEGLVNKVGILDFDFHYGNGTDDIIQRLGIDWVINYTNSKRYNAKSPSKFLHDIPEMVAELSDCDLILYQAGADAHEDDPLGGFLTSDQMRKRDRTVFEETKTWRLPLVWNLAGGYQTELFPSGKTSIRKVLALHDTTMYECINTYLKPAS